MDRDAEIALARSAAPSAISANATVLVLTPRGYETAVRGTNGFVCLVDRKWQAPASEPDFWDPKVRAPVCLNPQAARSVLPINVRRTELALSGLSKLDIVTRIREAFKKLELGPIEPGAMSYMMSPQQQLGDPDPRFQPHVMFYAPGGVTGSDWGANLPTSPVLASPEAAPDGGPEPVIIFIVAVGHWSDGSAAPASKSH